MSDETEFVANDLAEVDEMAEAITSETEAAAQVDLSTVDPTAVAVSGMFKVQLQKFEDGRDLFVEDRDAKKAGTQSTKALMLRMAPHATRLSPADVETFEELTATYLDALTEHFEDRLPGILSLLWNATQKDGDVYNFVVDRTTDIVTSGPASDDTVVPSITELAAMRTTVVGLFDALAAMVQNNRDILRALGVPTKYATKGRADGTKLVVAASELPKESKTRNTRATVIYMDEEEIYESGDGKWASIPACIRHYIGQENWKAFQTAYETKGQTQTTFVLEFGGHYFRTDVRDVVREVPETA